MSFDKFKAGIIKDQVNSCLTAFCFPVLYVFGNMLEKTFDFFKTSFINTITNRIAFNVTFDQACIF